MSQVQYRVSSVDSVPACLRWATDMIERGLKAGDVVLVLTRPKRSQEQNRKLWALLRDVSSQCQLVVNGQAITASPDDWKTVFTASLRGENRMAMGIDGGVVMLGSSTSSMTVAQFSELIELIHAYGDGQGVIWSAESAAVLEHYAEAA